MRHTSALWLSRKQRHRQQSKAFDEKEASRHAHAQVMLQATKTDLYNPHRKTAVHLKKQQHGMSVVSRQRKKQKKAEAEVQIQRRMEEAQKARAEAEARRLAEAQRAAERSQAGSCKSRSTAYSRTGSSAAGRSPAVGGRSSTKRTGTACGRAGSGAKTAGGCQ